MLKLTWGWPAWAFIWATLASTAAASKHDPLIDGSAINSIGRKSQSFALSNTKHTIPAIEPTQLRKPKKRTSLEDTIDALNVMQESFFDLGLGMWSTAIDWTSAVMSTHLAGTLTTLSSAIDYTISSDKSVSAEALNHENLVNKHFIQLVSFYFGQDAFALRTQAYDDMLWVVLGWLEGIKFVNLHSDLHYSEYRTAGSEGKTWHGKQWIPSFAHRARIFWDLAAQGWDTTLCGGGMVWSPYLVPYKNAITNELFIAASISMYLYFPGDSNASPFFSGASKEPIGEHDPMYLKAAIEGYKWLIAVNMTDTKGLYVDGFHINGWERHPRDGLKNTQCDAKNNMVYTYNQGVLLTGQRGLYQATGARSYLEDGHQLVKSVINATGYDLKHDRVHKGLEFPSRNHSNPLLPKWQGIGRGGIMEDACDASGGCSQDGQTFKGIFFHHLTTFCEPLDSNLFLMNKDFDITAFNALKVWHRQGCKAYGSWIRHNANFARKTKNDAGKYGMWWGAAGVSQRLAPDTSPDKLFQEGVDYRNLGLPDDRSWTDIDVSHVSGIDILAGSEGKGKEKQQVLGTRALNTNNDLNDRGRGRTVETQAGGVGVLRALWEIVEREDFEMNRTVSLHSV